MAPSDATASEPQGMLRQHPVGIPLPVSSPLSQTFWDGCGRSELLFQRCAECELAIFDPAPFCPGCTCRELEWEMSSGQGKVYSWTVVHRPPSPAFAVPYAVAIIDMEEGFQLLGNIVGCAAEAIYPGAEVAVEFHPIGGDVLLPYFRLETS